MVVYSESEKNLWHKQRTTPTLGSLLLSKKDQCSGLRGLTMNKLNQVQYHGLNSNIQSPLHLFRNIYVKLAYAEWDDGLAVLKVAHAVQRSGHWLSGLSVRALV